MNRSSSCFALALLLAVFAQGCSQLGGGSRHGGGSRGSSQDNGAQQPAEATRLSANDQLRLRLTNLRLALRLKPEQAGAWQAYEDKVLEFLSELGEQSGNAAGGNAFAQIDRRLAAEQRRAATMEQISRAARNLYSMLSDEQKRVADDGLARTIPAESLSR